MVLKIGLCDDNVSVIQVIKAAIENAFASHGIETDIAVFTNSGDLEDSLEHEEYNLLFLDIKMPYLNGIDLASKVSGDKKKKCDIIFVSSREEMVFDTFKVHPFAFVRKSNFLNDITEVIDRYSQTLDEKPLNKIVSFKAHGVRINISINQISYIEGTGVYQTIHFAEKKDALEISSRMEILEDELSQYGFIRIHKGFLVNFFYISSIDNDSMILMKDGKVLPISRRKLQETKDKFLKFCNDFNVLLF
ncbi:MAG: LytTR family DNA-binding domain-containing protein [Bacilli bacterium]